MESVKYHTEKLIVALKESDSYQKYEEVREEIAKDPELKRQLDEYRKRNYLMQAEDVPEDLFQEEEKMSREYKELRENELIETYLESELEICRKIQRIIQKVVVSIDMDIDEFVDDINL